MPKFISRFVLVGALTAIVASGGTFAHASDPSPMKKIAQSLIDTYQLPAGVTAKEVAKPSIVGTLGPCRSTSSRPTR